jgi:AcrR family transcriptional regulator
LSDTGEKVLTDFRKQKNIQRKEQTKSRLLDSAAAAFSRAGFHKTLISDIVADAGVGQGTFYRYFNSKREIFEALFDRLATEILAEFTPMSSQLPSDASQYQKSSAALLKRLVTVVEQNRDLVLLFVRQGPSIDRDFEARMTSVYEQIARLAQHYLDHASKCGFARQCRSDLVAQAIIGMALRLVDLWLDNRLPASPIEDVIDELVNFAFWGFGSDSGPRGFSKGEIR